MCGDFLMHYFTIVERTPPPIFMFHLISNFNFAIVCAFQRCVHELNTQFPNSIRVKNLKGLVLEAIKRCVQCPLLGVGRRDTGKNNLYHYISVPKCGIRIRN